MSAQAGIWNFDGKPADKNFLAKLSDAMSQYGPDGENAFFNGVVGMLYRPFHTTLESRLEQQPHISPRGLIITWDGRVDNREELIPQLHNDFMSQPTDVGIVLAAYERWGTDCFAKLIGDWALSIWDPVERTLLLAKDYAGIRHLYYYVTQNRLVWCTHLAPIVRLSGHSFSLNDEYIAGYLSKYPEAHLTPYREIHAVPPGHFVAIRSSKATTHRYWSFEPKRRIRYETDAEYEEHFRHVFRQAVRRRLRSDSPILAELSGGLDSSSIVCVGDDILAKGEAETPRLDTISYYDAHEPRGDERYYVSKVEEKRGRLGHHVDAGRFEPFTLDYVNFVASPGSLGTTGKAEADFCALAQQCGYRVVLSGDGGDEFLGGVPDPRPQLADLIVQLRLPEFAKQLMAWSLAKRRPWIHLLLQTLVHLLPPPIRARLTHEGKVAPWIPARFARRYRLATRQLGPVDRFGFWLPSRWEYAQTLASMTQQMAYSAPPLLGCRERRYPYLDRNLLEFLISVPASQLLRPGHRRSLMRLALAEFLPPEIAWRTTKGSVARTYIVALNSHWGEAESLFKAPLAARLGYINDARFRETLGAAKNGHAMQLVRIVKVLALELWLLDLAKRGLIYGLGRKVSVFGRGCDAVNDSRLSAIASIRHYSC